MTQPISKWRDFPVWLRVLAVIALVNFAVFWLVAVTSGGDAWNGYQRDGKFFLGSHGTYREVSHSFWLYSYNHVIATWITHGALFIGMAVFLSRKGTTKYA